MGKKPQRHSWPEAKKLCQLNQREIEMAKRLGFGPDALIRARPAPKQKWKLPVKYWIRELHAERFGEEPGDIPPEVKPEPLEYDEEAIRIYGEQLYWEDYRDRNAVSSNSRTRAKAARKPPEKSRVAIDPFREPPVFSEDEVPS